MTPKERVAIQQALEALEMHAHGAGSIIHTKLAWDALRETLAEPDIEEMTLTQIAARHEQAEQEPDYFGLTHDHTWLSIDKKQYDKLKPEGRMACYAAPVCTKDLTDEEQLELARSSVGKSRHWLVAAVIAAYKEKNRA